MKRVYEINRIKFTSEDVKQALNYVNALNYLSKFELPHQEFFKSETAKCYKNLCDELRDDFEIETLIAVSLLDDQETLMIIEFDMQADGTSTAVMYDEITNLHYIEIEGEELFDFSFALELMRDHGDKLARTDWKTGSYLVYEKGCNHRISCSSRTKETSLSCNPGFKFRNEKGIFEKWTPTTEDCLAENWFLFE